VTRAEMLLERVKILRQSRKEIEVLERQRF
jgi:hypothetical protein